VGAVDLVSDRIYNSSSDLKKQLITGNDSYTILDGDASWIQATRQYWITKDGDYSFSAWVYPEEDDDDRSVLMQNSNSGSDRNCLWMGNDSTNHWVSIGYYDGSWHSVSGNLTFNSWHHIEGINNGGVLSIYIDGVQWDESHGVYCHSIPAYLYIGRQSNNYDYIYNGSMDNILIFNRNISNTEVKELYELGRRDNLYTDDNLKSAWRFDDASSSTAIDSMGNNHGTFQGDATYGTIEYDEGYTEESSLIEYINTDGTRVYYTNYTVHAQKQCYPPYELYYNLTTETNIFDLLTLSATSQDWPWNLWEDCDLSNREYNVKDIVTFNTGFWEVSNVNLSVEDLDINSTDTWGIEFNNVRVVGK